MLDIYASAVGASGKKSLFNIVSKGLREEKKLFEPYISLYTKYTCISFRNVAGIMTQSSGHSMYCGRVLNTSLFIIYFFSKYHFCSACFDENGPTPFFYHSLLHICVRATGL